MHAQAGAGDTMRTPATSLTLLHQSAVDVTLTLS